MIGAIFIFISICVYFSDKLYKKMSAYDEKTRSISLKEGNLNRPLAGKDGFYYFNGIKCFRKRYDEHDVIIATEGEECEGSIMYDFTYHNAGKYFHLDYIKGKYKYKNFIEGAKKSTSAKYVFWSQKNYYYMPGECVYEIETGQPVALLIVNKDCEEICETKIYKTLEEKENDLKRKELLKKNNRYYKIYYKPEQDLNNDLFINYKLDTSVIIEIPKEDLDSMIPTIPEILHYYTDSLRERKTGIIRYTKNHPCLRWHLSGYDVKYTTGHITSGLNIQNWEVHFREHREKTGNYAIYK